MSYYPGPLQEPGLSSNPLTTPSPAAVGRKKSRRGDSATSHKRKCVSTACVACRKRKSKCDGAIPTCAACASVYGTECIYDPNSDHRRKGVYREKAEGAKSKDSTLQIIIDAIRDGTEDEAFSLVKKIRSSDSLEVVADEILRQDHEEEGMLDDESDEEPGTGPIFEGERDLARKMGELRFENGSVRFIGGTSHLIYLGDPHDNLHDNLHMEEPAPGIDPITSWTRLTSDPQLIMFLMNKYFNYHYPYFTTLSKNLFWQDFLKGLPRQSHYSTSYCSPLLVNAMLALGCHFTDIPEAYAIAGDSRTKGDHFFAEAKRIIYENEEYEKPRLVTVQALALMSVREAGCAREAKGWVYSGMSFRMAQDIGLNLELSEMDKERLSEHEIDARRITFWGCFLFDKCWSNYLGRLPLLSRNSFNVSKIDVFPDEDSELWRPFPDSGFDNSNGQPSRTRAIALQMSKLCEVSSDLLIFFYHPNHIGRSSGKTVELKKLSELHRRLEEWHQELPKELEAKEGQLPNVILMHMFFHLQYIHLFRPFLKYAPSASPLPSHISPRRICTANAGAISKLMRLYKKNWHLRQICNIAVYMTHSACTIHLLNLPEKSAKRDIIHGVKHLEEIAEDWLCARRTLSILSVLAKKWKCDMPEEATAVLQRTDEKYGSYSMSDVPSPRSRQSGSPGSEQAFIPPLPSEISSRAPYVPSTTLQNRPQAYPSKPMPLDPLNANQQGLSMGTPSLDFTQPDPLSGWTQAPTTISNYPNPSPFTPMPLQNMAKPQTSRQGPIDSPDWFLNDSARWQQSFEAWNMNNGDPMFMFSPEGGRGMDVNVGEHVRHNEAVGEYTSGLSTDMPGTGWLPGLD